MTKESLSEKIIESWEENDKVSGKILDVEDVKEKVQNAQERLKGEIKAEIKVAKKEANFIVPQILEGVILRINKIFKEEFGEKLLK